MNVNIYRRDNQLPGEESCLLVAGNGFRAQIGFTGFITDGDTVFFEAGGEPTAELVEKPGGYELSIYAAGNQTGDSTVSIELSESEADELLEFF